MVVWCEVRDRELLECAGFEFEFEFEFEFWREERESESVFESDSVPELGGVTFSAGVGLVANGSVEDREVGEAGERVPFGVSVVRDRGEGGVMPFAESEREGEGVGVVSESLATGEAVDAFSEAAVL